MILIADDFESERELVRGILEKLGFEVAEALDGQEAIEILRSGRSFEAVITDFNMPFKNGAEVVCEAISFGVPKILLRSSHSIPTLQAKLKEYEVDLNQLEIICKKDFDATELYIYLKRFLLDF